MVLTILAAPIGVPALVGPSWADAVVPVQFVAAITIVYVLGAFMGPLTIAVGRADWEFRWSVVTMCVALVAFPVGLQWGIVGVAASYLIMLTVLTPIRFAIVQRLIPIPASSYVRALAPAVVSSAALAFAWWLSEALLRGAASVLAAATIAAVIGTATYIVALMVGWPEDLRRQLEFARLVVRGDRN
jgi:O-antigen/teichoic acid export membrane protein